MSKEYPIGSDPPSILDDPSLISSRVVTPAEACILLKCRPTRLYELLNKKAIRSYKDGSNRRIFLVSLIEYQRKLARAAA
jgi:excisionase family DNA binding protein